MRKLLFQETLLQIQNEETQGYATEGEDKATKDPLSPLFRLAHLARPWSRLLGGAGGVTRGMLGERQEEEGKCFFLN